MKKLIPVFITLLSFHLLHAEAQNYEIYSPDKNINVIVQSGKSISYSVNYKSKTLVSPSELGMSFHPDIFSGKAPEILNAATRNVNEAIIPVVREKRSIIPDIYSELTIHFKQHFTLQFRVYNDGVAYRFLTSLSGDIVISSETACFNFEPGTAIYYPRITKRSDADIFHTSFEENYTNGKIDSVPSGMLAFTPLVLQTGNLPKVLITESDVNDYPGMFLEKKGTSGLSGRYAPYPKTEIISEGGFRQKLVTEREAYIARTRGTRSFPWRIIAVAPDDKSLQGKVPKNGLQD